MKTAKLTDTQKKAYLEDPSRCPFCLSENIDAGPVEILDRRAVQTVDCYECKRTWIDCYALVAVDDVD